MRFSPAAVLALFLLLSACAGYSDSNYNPMNWFDGSQPADQVTLVEPSTDTDPRPLVEQVVSMSVEPMQGGAIVRATGLPPAQGFWAGELTPRPLDENGRLIYDFRLVPPRGTVLIGTEFSREVTVGAFLTDIELADIRQIVVQGELNARSSGR
jgi:hypothetical protein